MTTEPLTHRVEALLESILDLSPAEQQAILAQQWPDEPGVCAQVEGLLARARPAFLNCLAAIPPIEEWFASDAPAVTPGTRLDDYDIEGEIGRGGMAVVYRARQISLPRVVALKMILIGQFASAEEVKRFRAEAAAVARLQHANIVQIHAVGEYDNLPFLALEYLDGGTLSAQLAGQPLPPRQAAQLTATLARAMNHAHARGIVHLDLKPANILLAVGSGQWAVGSEEGASLPTAHCPLPTVPKIADFGLARKWEEGGPAATASGVIRGTPSYMAPEQASESRTGEVGQCSDVYALGAILYELLTGRPPFVAATHLETLEQVRTQEPVPPRQLQPKVARDLETICLKCLEKEPARRYLSAAALAADLKRWLRGKPVRARRVGLLGHGWRWCRRKPLVAALMAALLLVVLGGCATSFVLWRRAVAGEDQAVEHLHQARTARQETEEHFAMLRHLLTNHVQVRATWFRPMDGPDTLPEPMLLDAEACLSRLLPDRADDQELRVLLAEVLTSLGMCRGLTPESRVFCERAAGLWEQLPPTAAREPWHRAARATTYRLLGQAYMAQGRLDLAVQAFGTAVHLWQQLVEEYHDPLYQDCLLYAATDFGTALIRSGQAEEEVARRFEDLRARPELLGGKHESEVVLVLLRVGQLYTTAEKHYQAKEWSAGLADARQAATLLHRHYGHASLDPKSYVWMARTAVNVSTSLRHGGAPREALRLMERVNGCLQELVPDARESHALYVELSQSWQQIGKARWDLDQVEETLDAFRHALEAQRQACVLEPTVAQYRQELGKRYLQLGRKYCELGRLDEAEACLRERQAHWPRDTAKHAEVLAELRKWATEAGKESSPEKRLERQRYLDLCARLEGQGVGAAPATASAQP